MGIERPKVIAVTVLTSLKPEHLIELGIIPEALGQMNEEEKQAAITELALHWTEASVRAGVDIILSSPKEIAEIHARWPEMILYTPGIRMPYSPPDDQNRTLTSGEAVLSGSQYLVIGRPIRKPEGGRTRKQVVAEIRADIAQFIAGQLTP